MMYYNPNVGVLDILLGGLQDENYFHNNTNMFLAFYSYYLKSLKFFRDYIMGPIT